MLTEQAAHQVVHAHDQMKASLADADAWRRTRDALIRAALADGATQRELAALLELAPSRVAQIATGCRISAAGPSRGAARP